VKHTLLDGFVEGGDSLPKNLLGPLLVAFGQGFAQVA
jgi:hypothetical protein